VRSNAESFDGAEDRELVAQVMSGQSDAFGAIVERYQDRLYNTVWRLVGNAEDARDLVQDTFVRTYENLGSFRGGSSLYTWMFRIAVNAGLSHRRRRKPLRLADADDGEDGRPIGWADPSSVNPADPLDAAETEAIVQRALGELDADQRAVVVLRDIQHLDYQEIADILEVPAGTVKSRLHRARLALRDRLRPLLKA